MNRDAVDRMELELNQMESALYDSYCEIGKVLLEAAETEGRRINKMVDEIIAHRKKLEMLQQEKDCPQRRGL